MRDRDYRGNSWCWDINDANASLPSNDTQCLQTNMRISASPRNAFLSGPARATDTSRLPFSKNRSHVRAAHKRTRTRARTIDRWISKRCELSFGQPEAASIGRIPRLPVEAFGTFWHTVDPIRKTWTSQGSLGPRRAAQSAFAAF